MTTVYCKICGDESHTPICQKCYIELYKTKEGAESHAFETELTDFTPKSNLVVLDLLKTGFTKIDFRSLKNLELIRISHCDRLTDVYLLDMPKLLSIDISCCPELTKARFESVNNVKAIDASYCKQLKSIDCDMMSVEYLSLVGTQFSELEYWPLLKYLDISYTQITDISFMSSYAYLQIVKMVGMQIKDVDLGFLTNLKYLASIESDIHTITFSSVNPETSLTSLYFANAKSVTGLPQLRNYNCAANGHLFGRKFEVPFSAGDWVIPYRRLFGPYPPPPGDIIKIQDSELVYDLPEGVDKNEVSNLIAGTIFGAALGDCLGMHAECKTPQYANYALECPIDIIWNMPAVREFESKYCRGGFTDDTALSLALMRSLVHSKGILDPKDLGQRIKEWLEKGVVEHKDGYGFGQGSSTRGAAHTEGFDEDPIKASLEFATKSDKKVTGNGGVMRVAPAALLKFWDEDFVISNAAMQCRVTHNTDVCAFSCIVVALLISRTIQYRLGLIKEFDVDSCIEKALEAQPIGEYEEEAKRLLNARTLDELELDRSVNATLQTAAAAVFVMRSGFNYEEGVTKIIRCGGDADTNAAVAGACLGARWGFGMLPIDVLEFFFFGGLVERDLKAFGGLMGIEFSVPESPGCGIRYPPVESTIVDPFAYQRFD